jgi:RNA polymerase subunit RPABC4/transcription elongation factor Spt4
LAKKERLCPLCQKPLEEGETTCKDCEEKILQEATETMREVMEPEEAEDAEDLGIDLDDLEKTLSEFADSEEEPSLYLCPVCGVLLADGASACPRCGAEFLEDEEASAEEEDEEEPKGILCMECGGLIEEGQFKCPHCGVEIVQEDEKRKVVTTKPSSDALYLCPRCGAFLKSDAESCDICGVHLDEKKKIGVGDIDKIAPEIPDADIGMCPTCGAFLDPETEECEICDAKVSADAEREAEELLTEMASEDGKEAEEGPVEPEEGSVEAEEEPVDAEEELPVGEESPVEEGSDEPETPGLDDEEAAILKELMTEGELDIEAEVPEGDELGIEEEIAAEKEAELEEEPIVTEEPEVLEEASEDEVEEIEDGSPEEIPKPVEVEAPGEESDGEPGEIDVEIDDFFEKLESMEIEKTMEEARLAPEPELVAEVEFDGDAEPRELPKVETRVESQKLIQRGKAKERARKVSWTSKRQGLPKWREYGAFAAVISTGIEYVALQFKPPFYEWIVIFLFAVLFALGISFVGLSFGNIPRRLLRNSSLLWLGTIMVILVPIHHFAEAGSDLYYVDYGLLIGGLALSLIGILLMGRGVQTHMVWTSGSLMILIAAFPLAFPLGSWSPGSGVEISMFVLGSSLVLLSFGFVIYDKWLKVIIDTQILYGDESMRRRRPTESLRNYDAAIKASSSFTGAPDVPSNSDLPWYSKGAALTILGRYEEALECIDAALKINPINEVAWVNRGTALTRLGKHREALKSFNEAIKQNPSYEVAWNNKGNTLARLKRFDEALKSYEMAIEIDEMYREAWVNKGYILAKMGRYEDAARCADFVASFSSAR